MQISGIQLTSSLVNLLKTSSSANLLELEPGNIVPASVIGINDNLVALLQVQGVRLRTKLDAELRVGDKVNLLVTGKFQDGAIELKLVGRITTDASDSKSQVDISQVLKAYNIPQTEEGTALVSELIQRNLPVSGQTLLKSLEILRQFAISPENIRVLSNMVELGLPLEIGTFQIMQAVKERPLGEQLQELANSIQQVVKESSRATGTISAEIITSCKKLNDIISRLLCPDDFGNLNDKVVSLGQDYEQTVAQAIRQALRDQLPNSDLANRLNSEAGTSLKYILLMLEEKTPELKRAGLKKVAQDIQKVLNQITAHQLVTQSLQEKLGMFYRFYSLPVTVDGQVQTMQFQILSGQRNGKQLEHTNYYILVSVDLPHLGALDIHMNFADQSVGIRFVCEQPTKFSMLNPDKLRQGLKSVGFALNTLAVENTPVIKDSYLSQLFSKVDLKI